MAKCVVILLLVFSSIGFSSDKANEFCVLYKWGRAYSGSSHNLFCGVSGEQIVSERARLEIENEFPYMSYLSEEEIEDIIEQKIIELDLYKVSDVEVAKNVPFSIYERGAGQTVSESIVVITNDLLSFGIGVGKKKIGHSHKILSSFGIESKLKDDLNNTSLSQLVLRYGFVHAVKAISGFSHINVYVKY